MLFIFNLYEEANDNLNFLIVHVEIGQKSRSQVCFQQGGVLHPNLLNWLSVIHVNLL